MTARRLARKLTSAPSRACRRASSSRSSRREDHFRSSLSLDDSAPEVLLSPHCDDAVLSCWSLLAGDRELIVVNLFTGIPAPGQAGSWEALVGVGDSAERTRMRIAEDARALALAGRTPVNLALRDAQFRGRVAGSPSLPEIDRALTDVVQSASRVYVPAAIGFHADHLLARRYGRTLLRVGMPVSVYADLPYCTFHGWPAWVDGGEPAPHRDVDAYWRASLKSVPEMPPLRSAEVVRLDERAAFAKSEAVWCYEASLNYGVRYLMADPAFGAFEVRWQLEGAAEPS